MFCLVIVLSVLIWLRFLVISMMVIGVIRVMVVGLKIGVVKCGSLNYGVVVIVVKLIFGVSFIRLFSISISV